MTNLGEPQRGSRTAVIDSAQRLWGWGGSSGVLSDAIAAGTTGTALGGPAAGISAAAAVGGNALRRAIGGKLTRASSKLIQTTADRLTATGTTRDKLIAALIERAVKLPQQRQTAATIEKMAKAILQTNAGRLGYEGQNLFVSHGGR